MNPTSAKSLRPAALLALLLLGACASVPDQSAQAPESWPAHQAEVGQIASWSLRGRLNVRQESGNDTVSLNWDQSARTFAIRFSGTLGLGAVSVHGDDSGIVVEKSGEPPQHLANLQELSRTYLAFDFPAEQLLFWVRGLPDPDLPSTATWNESNLLATLQQTDLQGRRWSITFDRYDLGDAPPLPGRIRLEQDDVRLTFLISDWQVQPALLARL